MMGKKIVALSVLAVVLCGVQVANGLPYTGSVYYDFTDDGRILSGRIDFGVFDRQVDTFAATPPGDGRYIYAYQIWNDQGNAQEAVGYFSILLEGAIVDGIGSEALGGDQTAVEPSHEDFDPDGDPIFLFQIFDSTSGSIVGIDYLDPGAHSYILIFTSDSDWVAGDYHIGGGGLGYQYPLLAPEGEPPTETPEPATIFILGMGAVSALVMKRK
jgi:hypothetical protein